MPLKWLRGVNPYVFNYFGKLRIGPNAPPTIFQAQAKRSTQNLAAGRTVELAGQVLDEHAINEASRKLLDPAMRAGELLLVHPQGRQSGDKLKSVADQIRKAAVPPDKGSMPPLIHATAIYWFLPEPGPEAADLPAFESIGLVNAGDDQDLMLDIVFDE